MLEERTADMGCVQWPNAHLTCFPIIGRRFWSGQSRGDISSDR